MNQAASTKTTENIHQQKSKRARNSIIKATIKLLDKVGYSETSLMKVCESAGYTKGAIQYHFRSKEELISQTVDVILSRTFPPKNTPQTDGYTVEEFLFGGWSKFVNTPDYRALTEILSASRTDKELHKKIRKNLVAWGKKADKQTIDTYEAVSGDPEQAVILLNMHRSFMRGLLFQEQYGLTKKDVETYMRHWVSLIAPLLKLKKQV